MRVSNRMQCLDFLCPVPRSILLFVAAVFLNFSASAQISQAWVARYNNGITNGTNQAVKMALDSNGNVIVTGFSQNTNNQLGYVTIKYAPNGTQLWAARFDSTNYPMATPAGMALDSSNDIIVTGSALTIKYDTNGNILWTASYAGSALAVDTNGNAAVTGFGTSFNTVELNPSGTALWEHMYSSGCGNVGGQAIAVDASGNVYVVGSYPFFCESGLVDYELIIYKCDPIGTELWSVENQDGGNSWQTASAMCDTSGSLYVSGNFNEDSKYVGFVYDSDGNLVWGASTTRYTASVETASGVDRNQCMIMSGEIPTAFLPDYTPLFSYGTVKVSTNGSTLWTSFYPETAVATSVATAIAVDQTNNSYVTGYSPGTNGTNNIVTIKYGPGGNQLWLQQYNDLHSGNDAGNAIAVDNNGNVYVTGYETLPGGGTGIVTIKYIPISIQRQTNGTVIIQAAGTPGEMFDIEASTNLQTWLDLGTVTADTNGLMQFDDTNAVDFPFRFYYTNPK